MRILKIVLDKYKRLMLTNITTFNYTPIKPIQIIAGTNGSGKSSVMAELSPLPANITKDYGENGYKEFHCIHNGKPYTLLSGGRLGRNKHSFIEDGKELNPGGTKKVQLILCKDIFGITPMIHEVLTNVRPFTSMPIGERKQWLSYISTVDYKYPLEVFKRITTEYRDLLGGVKILDTKITSVKDSKCSSEVLKSMEEELYIISGFIRNITRSLGTGYTKRVEISTDELKVLNTKLLKSLKDFKTLSDIKTISEEEFNKLQRELGFIDERIKTTLKQIEELEKVADGSISELEHKLEELQKEKTKLQIISDKIGIGVYQLSSIKHAFKSIEFKLFNLLDDIMLFDKIDDINYQKDLTERKLYKLTERYNDLKRTHKKLTLEFQKLDILKNKKETQCPKCSHTWIEGFDKKRYDELSKDLSNIENDIGNIEKEITELKDSLMSLTDCHNKIQLFYQTFFSKNELKVFLPYFQELSFPTDVFKAKDFLNTLSADLNFEHSYESLINEEKKVKTYIDTLKTRLQTQDKKSLENTVNDLYDKKYRITSEIDLYKRKLKVEKDLSQSYTNVELELSKLGNNYHRNRMYERNKLLLGFIKELEDKKLTLEKSIYDAKYADGLINDLQTEKDRLLKRIEILRILIKTLSPTEGLIAKSMLSFLGVFVKSINTVISNIWSYDMKLQLPDIEDGNDLDYKFKVVVENNINDPIEDIKITSSGMKEVIDLAHRIIVMHFLGLKEYPLFLDEFGSKFDPVHKQKAHEIVKNLSEEFNQIFIISHEQDMFVLYDSDITILSKDNMFMSEIKEYNKVASIS